MLAILVADYKVSCRNENSVELGSNHILHKDAAGTLFSLNLNVKRKAYGNILDSAVGCSGIVKSVASINYGLRTRDKGLVFILARKTLLELRHLCAELVELLGTGEVLQDDVCTIGTLDAVKIVIAAFARAEDQVHLAVVGIKPLQSALLV